MGNPIALKQPSGHPPAHVFELVAARWTSHQIQHLLTVAASRA